MDQASTAVLRPRLPAERLLHPRLDQRALQRNKMLAGHVLAPKLRHRGYMGKPRHGGHQGHRVINIKQQ